MKIKLIYDSKKDNKYNELFNYLFKGFYTNNQLIIVELDKNYYNKDMYSLYTFTYTNSLKECLIDNINIIDKIYNNYNRLIIKDIDNNIYEIRQIKNNEYNNIYDNHKSIIYNSLNIGFNENKKDLKECLKELNININLNEFININIQD